MVLLESVEAAGRIALRRSGLLRLDLVRDYLATFAVRFATGL